MLQLDMAQTLILACVLLAAGLHFGGCAAHAEERRIVGPALERATAQAIADARAEIERCAGIEVFSVGQAPARPFRRIGLVTADWTFSTEGRVRTLRSEACALGADAVVSAREIKHESQSGERWVSARGDAVVFVDHRDDK